MQQYTLRLYQSTKTTLFQR